MGKKAVTIIGSQDESDLKAKQAEKLRQKKLRGGHGKTLSADRPADRQVTKAPGLTGGQRVVDTAEESLRELEIIEKKQQAISAPEETKKVKKLKIRSKPYQTAKSKVDMSKLYPLSEAIKLLRDISLAKFNGTVELHLVLKDLPAGRQGKEVDLPHSTGKTRKVAIADDKTLAQIEKGQIDFDILYASPDQMSKLVKYAKILGPKGLMPNPKTGTVVPDPEETIKKQTAKNTIFLKTEKSAPLIHTIVGKLSATDLQLIANIQAILASLPQISKAVLKSTMSPAIKLLLV